MKCINCKKYTLNLSDKRKLAFKSRFQLNPTMFICPECGSEQCSTEVSLLVRVLLFPVFIFGGIFLVVHVEKALKIESFFFVLVVGYSSLFIYHRYISPNIMVLKKHQTLAESLPKSRAKGYFTFLVLPIVGIVLLFILGVTLS